ncbi:MAG: TRAP transporter substrate-binding protein [Clostridia bacterium]|nr:TRAP transporter substrate-binding protein [Clostridia bacterium]
MKKLVLALMMAALLVLSVSAMAEALPDASKDPAVTLVYAEVNPLDTTVVGQVALHFAQRVNELSGGTVTIDVQGGGVLGAEGDFCDNMIGGIGTIDMARLSVSTLTGYGVPKSTLLCLPFVFTSRDHFWNFAGSDLAQEFMDEPYEQGLGLHGLFIGEEGFRHIFTNKPVSNLDDIQGLKIRVSTDPTMVGMIEAFGANATVVAYGELYQSLQSGVVDGAENPVGNYKANSFYEVAPYLLLDGHQLGVIELVITDMAWNKLTAAQQECIKIAAKECQEYNKQLSEKVEEDTLAELGDKITVVEVNKAEWIEKCKDVIAKATKDYADLYQKIEDLQ